uniref:Uncharacterized protein n=1 Tax=viral metagenome TaxID=1070528 RepID=A0A6C0E177_9ZZZZ
MIKICAPALIYIVFSLTQIIVDTLKGYYNTAFLKMIVSMLITILLNTLCKSGMSIISWFIVFIPFIFTTFIVSILLYVFGLDVATGKLPTTCNITSNKPNQDIPINTQVTSVVSLPNTNTSDPQYESFM